MLCMSSTTVQVYRFRCDAPGCSVTETGESLPKQWRTVSKEFGPCGLTDYYTIVRAHFCPTCAENGSIERWKAI